MKDILYHSMNPNHQAMYLIHQIKYYMKGRDAKQEKTHFHGAGSVPGLHQVCSALILPADEVMERNSSFPVREEVRKGNEQEWKKITEMQVTQVFSSVFPSLCTSHTDISKVIKTN